MLIKILLVSCVFLFQSCLFQGQSEPSAMQNMKEVKHPNGLVINIPQGFTARETNDGLIVEPEGDKNSQVRYPIAVYVMLVKGKGVPQEIPLQTKSIRGKEIHYHTEKSEGGSGGEEHFLEAYEVIKDGYISYSQSAQSKYDEPDFSLCWQIVEYASVKN